MTNYDKLLSFQKFTEIKKCNPIKKIIENPIIKIIENPIKKIILKTDPEIWVIFIIR